MKNRHQDRGTGMVFPEFPESEYLSRHAQLVALGREHGIDAYIFTDEENLRYFAGGPLTDAHIFRSDYMAAIIPTDTEKPPRLVLSEARVVSAQGSWITDTRTWGGSIESVGEITVDVLVHSLRDLGLHEGMIAMETSCDQRLYMPISVYEEIRRQLPGMKVVPSFNHVMAVRAIKSPLEIECIREACRITSEAIEHGFSIVREGTTEKEIYRTVKARMHELGAERVPFLTVIAGWEGRSICWDSLPTDYAVRPGDPIQIDGGCTVRGYIADMTRTASLESITKAGAGVRFALLYDTAVRAHHAVCALLKAGTPIRDVCAAGVNSITHDGYADNMVFGVGQTGHGIGLGIHELPFLVHDSQESLEPGMVVAIEPSILEYPELDRSAYFTIVESDYLITETGCEQLTNSPHELRVLT